MKMTPPTSIPLRHLVMLLSRNKSALLRNILFSLVKCITLDSLPAQTFLSPNKGSAKIQLYFFFLYFCACLSLSSSFSPSHSFCIMSVLYGICVYNHILHFYLSYTKTATVLRSLYKCNKSLLPVINHYSTL